MRVDVNVRVCILSVCVHYICVYCMYTGDLYIHVYITSILNKIHVASRSTVCFIHFFDEIYLYLDMYISRYIYIFICVYLINMYTVYIHMSIMYTYVH